jgi:transcriptional regulator with XRE-family HTH domain
MKEKGITRAGLAKGSGVPYTTIVNFYEKGSDNIKLSTLKKFSKYFNVSLDYLANDENTEIPKEDIKSSLFYDLNHASKDELDELENFFKFLKSKRDKK